MWIKVARSVLKWDLHEVRKSGELTATMIHFALLGVPLALHIFTVLV
jgi:hypothetical protein